MSEGSTVGDVIVTAQRREQKLRNVPSTVNVVTGDQLAARGPINNTGDILAQVPGVRYNNLQNPLLSEVSIRGSGTGRSTSADPAIGLFANGVYVGGGSPLGRNFSLIDSFDLARTEVLEGPQGALYGRNAEFGVVNMVSQQPKFVDEGYVDDTYSFETQSNRATAVVNHALSDDLAIRLGVEDIEQSSGFILDPDTHNYYDKTQGWMGRAQIRYAPGKLDVTLLAQVQRLELPDYAQVTSILPGTISTFPLGFTANRYSIPVDGNEYTSEDVNNLVLLANYDFGWAKLASTSSYRLRSDTTRRGFQSTVIDLQTEASLQSQGEQGTYPFALVAQTYNTQMYYQDLHLNGVTLADRLNWLFGGEGLHYNNRGSFSQGTDPCATVASPNPVVGRGVCGGTLALPTCTLLTAGATTCPAVFPSPFGSFARSRETYTSWAVYSSLAYKIGWGFTLSGDIRFTDDNKQLEQTTDELYTSTPYPYITGGSAPNLNLPYRKDFTTWTSTLSWKVPWVDGLIYGKAGTGYRAGDANTRSSPPLIGGLLGGKAPPAGYAPVEPSYSDENLISYELGYKGNLTHSIYFTLAAYTSKMKNAIVAVSDGCALNNSCDVGSSAYNVNAGDVDASGIEATLNSTWHLFDGVLNVQLTGSDQTASYENTPATRPGLAVGQPTGLPLNGSSVPQNPHWLASAAANYRRHLFGNVDGFANMTVHGQWGGIQDPAVATLPGIGLANFQDFDLRTGIDYKQFEVAVIAQNFTDETHVQLFGAQHSTIATLPYFPTLYRYSLPGTVALEVKYKW